MAQRTLFDLLSLQSLGSLLLLALCLGRSVTPGVAASLLSLLWLSRRRHLQLLAWLRAAQLGSLAVLALSSAAPRLPRSHAYAAPRLSASLAQLFTAISLLVRCSVTAHGWRAEPAAAAFDALICAALHSLLAAQCGCESAAASVWALGRRLVAGRSMLLYLWACHATCAVTQRL